MNSYGKERKIQLSDRLNWKIITQKYFENIGKNFLIFNMKLDSFKSLENELTKNIPAFYKELLNTWIICGGGGK